MTVFKPCDRVHLRGHALVSSSTGTITGADHNGDPLVRWDDNHAITPHDTYVLEPLGEPMSHDAFAEPGSHNTESIVINKQDLPLVGALLTGTADEAWARALIALAVHEQLRTKEEASDREALEGEALELFNALREANDNNLVDGFHDIPSSYQETWLAVAKTSRALHGATK